jgi:hypothetical protein
MTLEEILKMNPEEFKKACADARVDYLHYGPINTLEKYLE